MVIIVRIVSTSILIFWHVGAVSTTEHILLQQWPVDHDKNTN